MNYYRVFSKFYERAAKKMCLECQDFIKRGSRILDLGCGSGIVGKSLQDFFRAEVIGVDIKDRRIINIPFKIIDGRKLPFPENSFDIIFISYVLHHSSDPLALIGEAKRVSNKKIIVYEDLPEGFISKIICKFHGISYNKLFRNPNVLSFKTENNLEKIFQEIGLNVIFKKRINNFPVKKELFILGV